MKWLLETIPWSANVLPSIECSGLKSHCQEDWPHLQTTCFALRHCRKTHLDTQKPLIKPNCQPRSPWTIQTQTLEHTWTYIPTFHRCFHRFYLLRVEVAQSIATAAWTLWDVYVDFPPPRRHSGALGPDKQFKETFQTSLDQMLCAKDDDDGGLNLASGWWEVYGSIRSRGFESIRIVSALISTWLAISLHCSAMLGGDTTWR